MSRGAGCARDSCSLSSRILSWVLKTVWQFNKSVKNFKLIGMCLNEMQEKTLEAENAVLSDKVNVKNLCNSPHTNCVNPLAAVK